MLLLRIIAVHYVKHCNGEVDWCCRRTGPREVMTTAASGEEGSREESALELVVKGKVGTAQAEKMQRTFSRQQEEPKGRRRDVKAGHSGF